MSKITRVLLLAVFVGFAYYAVRLNQQLGQESAISARLGEEKQQLEASLFDMESKVEELNASLQEKESQLRALSDAAAIKNALLSAQSRIQEMSAELARVNNERVALQEAHLTASNKLQNTTKEFLRATAELKTLKGELDKSQLASLKSKLDELTKANQSKEEQVGQLRKELAELQSDRQRLLDASKELEKKLKGLGSQKVVDSQDLALEPLQRKITQLNESLAEKDIRIKSLEAELGTIGPSKTGQTKQVAQLQEKISRLEDDLEAAEKSARRGSKTQDDDLRAQLGQISEILVRKEVELDKAKRDAMAAMDKVLGLQSKMSDLEKSAGSAKASQDKIRDLEVQLLTLQSRLNESSQTLVKKNELIDSLQKNVDYLNVQLTRKEEEKRTIEERIAQAESLRASSQEELSKQKARTAEVDLLYSSLRTQINQLTDLLNDKQAELGKKNKEIAALREDVASVKQRSSRLEEELSVATDRQKKTLDDLSAAIRMNAVLQEKAAGALRGSDSGAENYSQDRQSADELRRKIEVILETPQR